ncbi:ABC transporter permease [Microlunatus soli]|uniref:Nucleoside ABC transporter membrane protein n=1 Tax=Microlunatus soli TaxID=630515 RepID=A0A1H1X258_9ACTN|nr:ABC transporter permease [Microlunatus soli]SDT03415.1 nucleoside ABC transporter membrane protein [Microlunatus soli]
MTQPDRDGSAELPKRTGRGRFNWWRRLPWADIWTTIAAFVLALLIGAILMIVSDPDVMAKFSYFFGRPGDALQASADKVGGAYFALLKGAFGGWQAITESTSQAAPLILAGLGVALAFRTGLINIGAQGQAIWGAVFAAYIGFALHLPPGLHLILAILAGVLAGGIWGGIVGFLKARTGAHEVIVTIMLNYVASGMLAYLLTTTAFRRPGRADPISPVVDWNATFPRLAGSQLHLGFVIALLAAVAVWWILEKSTIGFALKAVGSNPNAAATAGMSVSWSTVIAMTLAGALAGLAGVDAALSPSVSGTPVPLSAGIVGTVGFDAVTVALLGRSRPVGVVLAGLLFGALHTGGLAMQSQAQTPLTLTTVLQALIVLFVAAPALVGRLLPFLRERRLRTGVPTSTGSLS